MRPVTPIHKGLLKTVIMPMIAKMQKSLIMENFQICRIINKIKKLRNIRIGSIKIKI
jgi:hypothetical protein